MSENIGLEWIGKTLLSMQSEQRNLRDENARMRAEIRAVATDIHSAFRAALDTPFTIIISRIGEMEVAIERRMAALESRFDSIETRLDHRP